MTIFDRYFAGETLHLDEHERAGKPGRFVQLTDGVTHYELGGPVDGKQVVLVHGFSVPYFIWDPTVEALIKGGYRTLRYDLYGRGYSDRPLCPNNKEFFVRQLAELLEALKIGQPVGLLSLSLGGVVASEFACTFPESVAALAFVDPAGFELSLPWTLNMLRTPLVGEFILGVLGLFGHRRLIFSMLSDFYNPTQQALEAFVPRYVAQMPYQGFKRSLLSTLREGLLDEDLNAFRAVGKSRKPTLLIWGTKDATVPFRHAARFQQLAPHTEFHPIEKAGHIPHFERPEVVNPLLIDFLTRSL